MNKAEMRRRLGAARVGRLATVRPDGTPHLVPICFALVEGEHGDVIVSPTDEKPKTTYQLRRLKNIAVQPAVSLITDHYEEEWTRVWWVRVDGRGRVIDDGAEHDDALAALRAKYDQYQSIGMPGAVLAIDVDRWTGWSYLGE